ncbi:hypothetical protein [Aureibacter tunicatorum]|uniref:Uncharacterized protein n=1 Tax=Aureibacter tunicatorum TaxID=866807 RepID=A0AAE4BSH0_9BACT|nr:hypothetical protein [Aureibacter tunicatorum]MDR6238828.1 hypothetical protein [Aureibacter tunicatorum]BDD05245.1 hypothetical protein AUTU_27280 [Aureibacter tunicatorum]
MLLISKAKHSNRKRNNNLTSSNACVKQPVVQAMLKRFKKKKKNEEEDYDVSQYEVTEEDEFVEIVKKAESLDIGTDDTPPTPEPQESQADNLPTLLDPQLGAISLPQPPSSPPPDYQQHDDFTETYRERVFLPDYDTHKDFTKSYLHEHVANLDPREIEIQRDAQRMLNERYPVESIIPVEETSWGQRLWRTLTRRRAQEGPAPSLPSLPNIPEQTMNQPQWRIEADPYTSNPLSDRLRRLNRRYRERIAHRIPEFDWNDRNPTQWDGVHSRMSFSNIPEQMTEAYYHYIRFFEKRAMYFVKQLGAASLQNIKGISDRRLCTTYNEFLDHLIEYCIDCTSESSRETTYSRLLQHAEEKNAEIGVMFHKNYLRGMCHAAHYLWKKKFVDPYLSFGAMNIEDIDFIREVRTHEPSTMTGRELVVHGIHSSKRKSSQSEESLLEAYRKMYSDVRVTAYSNKWHYLPYQDAMAEIMRALQNFNMFEFEDIFLDSLIKGLALRILFELREKRF